MMVKCRGFVGELIYLNVSAKVRNMGREPVNLYSIEIQLDKSSKICMENVKDVEIEAIK